MTKFSFVVRVEIVDLLCPVGPFHDHCLFENFNSLYSLETKQVLDVYHIILVLAVVATVS